MKHKHGSIVTKNKFAIY